MLKKVEYIELVRIKGLKDWEDFKKTHIKLKWVDKDLINSEYNPLRDYKDAAVIALAVNSLSEVSIVNNWERYFEIQKGLKNKRILKRCTK